MYKKILVLLDGSEFSECVLPHVKAIAAGCNVPEVVLLTVIDPVPAQIYAELGESRVNELENKARGEAQNNLSKSKDRLGKDGVEAQAVVVLGKPADQILDYANRNQVDLIIMSTHGRSGISRWVFGSVADKIMRHSAVPVLIVTPRGCRTEVS